MSTVRQEQNIYPDRTVLKLTGLRPGLLRGPLGTWGPGRRDWKDKAGWFLAHDRLTMWHAGCGYQCITKTFESDTNGGKPDISLGRPVLMTFMPPAQGTSRVPRSTQARYRLDYTLESRTEGWEKYIEEATATSSFNLELCSNSPYGVILMISQHV